MSVAFLSLLRYNGMEAILKIISAKWGIKVKNIIMGLVLVVIISLILVACGTSTKSTSIHLNSLEIVRVDADEPTVMPTGAIFRITNYYTGEFWDIRTDDSPDGVARKVLEVGVPHIVTEISAPVGYWLSDQQHRIVLGQKELYTITIGSSRVIEDLD